MPPSDRRRLLEPFFVATDQHRDEGKKVPAPAHEAIAQLVKRGTVRVIVTTNFDDLLEQALQDMGVPIQVIAAPDMIAAASRSGTVCVLSSSRMATTRESTC